jgi:hypothetical protein
MVTICKKLDNFLPKYDKNKPKWRTLTEIYIQLIMIVSTSYIVREVLNYLIKGHLGVIGHPDKFAIIILGSPMFSQQPNLLDKIKYIWINV